MFLIYNCGYHSQTTLIGEHTKKRYTFRKRFVTEVNDQDGESFLRLAAKDIPWCPKNSKSIPPFMKLEDWCSGKEGRFDSKPLRIYDAEEYRKLFLLK